MVEARTVTVFRGDAVHTAEFGEIELLTDKIFIVEPFSAGGKIVEVAPGNLEATVLDRFNVPATSVIRLKEGQFLVPGFIDLHVHAMQYSYTGTGTDVPLMQWLQQYAFPREARMRDKGVAEVELKAVVSRLLSYGTTTALYFASLDLEPSCILSSIAHKAGQRAFVGLVAMDRNGSEDYEKSTEDNIADLRKFVDFIRRLEDPVPLSKALVQPVVTPRFIPTCSTSLLAGLGAVAAELDLAVQSHISESLDEVATCEQLHPEVGGRDLPLFEGAGLLRQRSVYAHAVALTPVELEVFAEKGAAVAHCPLSNFFFADMPFRVRRALHLGVKVGLGTDVAGGYSPSMLEAMRAAVVTTKAVRMQTIAQQALARELVGTGEARHAILDADPDADLMDYRGAFWLATKGGAQALGLEDVVGDFEVGKEFDALIVDTRVTDVFDMYACDTALDSFQKFINLGDDRNIKAVYIRGRLVR